MEICGAVYATLVLVIFNFFFFKAGYANRSTDTDVDKREKLFNLLSMILPVITVPTVAYFTCNYGYTNAAYVLALVVYIGTLGGLELIRERV
jgi:hypothetical protein